MNKIKRDFPAYHRSIAHELCAAKNRVRSLIGDKHWATDGEHRETVLRSVLERHLSENLRIGRGFVCFREIEDQEDQKDTSYQIDILITKMEKPTLYKEGDLVFVTPDCVSAIIEVKSSAEVITSVDPPGKLADDVAMIREYNPHCKAGLFVYENRNSASPTDDTVLKSLHRASKDASTGQATPLRAVNWVAVGPNPFSSGRLEAKSTVA